MHVMVSHIKGDFDWAAASTLLAGLLAALGVLLGLLANAASTRRQRRTQIYADAVGAVSDYLEGPYRVMRCPDDRELRFSLTQDISSIQSRVDAHLVLIQMSAPKKVHNAFTKYVHVAREEAGQQMREQWDESAPKRRSQMHAPERFDQPLSIAARGKLIKLMARDSKPQWKVWRYFF